MLSQSSNDASGSGEGSSNADADADADLSADELPACESPADSPIASPNSSRHGDVELAYEPDCSQDRARDQRGPAASPDSSRHGDAELDRERECSQDRSQDRGQEQSGGGVARLVGGCSAPDQEQLSSGAAAGRAGADCGSGAGAGGVGSGGDERRNERTGGASGGQGGAGAGGSGGDERGNDSGSGGDGGAGERDGMMRALPLAADGWNSVVSRAAEEAERGNRGGAAKARHKQWLVFEVADTGCGVAAEGLRRLFREYVQVSA